MSKEKKEKKTPDWLSLQLAKMEAEERIEMARLEWEKEKWHELLGNEAHTIARLIREGKIPNEETINFKCFTDF